MNPETPATPPPCDVLIVDDSHDAADTMRELLNMLGFQASVAHGAQQGLAFVRASRPLCVILDVNMPDMDGLELSKALRKECGDDVVLIAITGSDASDERAAQTFAIVDHHFTKPVNIAELERVLRV